MAEPVFDITIVGAGIAGSALAAALTGRGLSLALVEARALPAAARPPAPGLHGFDARVSALTPRSQAFLERLDVWPGVVSVRACPYRHMTVWDAEGTGSIQFDAEEVGAPALGTIVENRVLVDALLARFRGAPDIAVHAPESVARVAREGSRVALELAGGATLRSKLVVAADGALSPLREALGFRTREWDYGHRAIVATVQLEHCHGATAWQRFLPTGPLALLPLPDGEDGSHRCSIVWSIEDDRAEELLALDDDGFCAALAAASEHRLGAVLASTPRLAFPLHQRHAVDYIAPGVALVADAAHTIHPLAGQGINLGLADVEVLAAQVLRAAGRGLDPGRLDVLRRYQRERKGDNLLMMAAMEGFKRLFGARALPLRWLRNSGLRLVDGAAPLKRELIRQALGAGR
ncbi:UbiH/UbiF/VisC/COQ6 family ubiquinone biosynthesis hydroxylase [Pseudohaliea rubra]|uniref:2-octaprenyl-3-methyl-6-methoxy-1,4-benzoquinol hydroxylase n=1 Tax=Pseudohaliea rubra DSM 19751 TaxID=1265313 RepID=A0A095VRX5_9GAMM|nr:UbiH/UbiF/VisC/COQ6 family ubiquinone biosynthesis hydroxylase [Pseudohaliea rubra]KGE04095.1 2-octaprenyl-3-methyl-6-methoxy-1,4-benzoquinol hydroxylase [Pseudohaliea rubra DSM 19751]